MTYKYTPEEIGQLNAEIERLRAVLKTGAERLDEVAVFAQGNSDCPDGDTTWGVHAQSCREVAKSFRAAFEQREKNGD